MGNRPLNKSKVFPAATGMFTPFVVFTALVVSTWAQYSIRWHTLDGGGGISSNNQYYVTGTIGQPDVSDNTLSGGPYTITGGFWAYLAVQAQGTPFLSIMYSDPGQLMISWDSADTGWVLQESLSLSDAVWTNSSSGSINPVVVPVSSPVKFYRLHKP